MKYQNYSTNTSKTERFYNIFLENPNTIFNSKDLMLKFNNSFEDKIPLELVSMMLTRLSQNNKILRTKTQTQKGFLYSLKNQKRLDALYFNYLSPYNFTNKEKIVELMLLNQFEKLKTNFPIPPLKNYKFFNKYEPELTNLESTKIFLAKLVAFVMGDGNIQKNSSRIIFFFKEQRDVEVFKKNILQHFPKEKPRAIKIEFCYACQINNKNFMVLLNELGAPQGNKVFQPFKIPNWIYHGPNPIKLAFLSTIYGNEGSKPQDNRWRIQFVLSKNQANIEDLLIFLNQIKIMLYHFNISTSFTQIRKQKGRQFHGRFYIKGKENLHKFYKLLEFSYASEKQKVLEDLILRDLSSKSVTVQ